MQENNINKGRLVAIIRNYVNEEVLQPGESLHIFRNSLLLWTIVKKDKPVAEIQDEERPATKAR